MLAAVVQGADAIGAVVLAAGLVTDEGIVRPAVPEAVHHPLEFAGTGIAFGMPQMAVAAEIAGFRGGIGSHQVPAGAPRGQLVQRGEGAGHRIGFVIAGGDRGHQADALGHPGQRGQQGERLEQIGAGHARGLGTFGGGHAVGDEQQVEAGGFRQAGERPVVRDVHPGATRHGRMAPGCDMVTGGHEKGAQVQLSAHAQKSLRTCTPK